MSIDRPSALSRMQSRASSAVTAREDFVANHVGDSIQIKPVPVAALRRSGPRALRVLLFGGGPLVGLGLRDHNLGLPGQVADQLTRATNRGVEMDVVADAEPVRRSAIEGIRGLRLWRYDAIVAVLGQPSSRGSAHEQAFWTSELVRTLLVEGNPTAPLFVWDSSLTLPTPQSLWARSAARRLREQREAAERACARTGRVRFGDLTSPHRMPAEGRPFDGEQFEEWAQPMVRRLLQQLDSAAPVVPAVRTPVPHADDERLRQRALESLRLNKTANPRLERIVRTARELYGASGAAINIIDNDRQWSKAANPPLEDLAREITFCNHAIQVDDSTLINDTLLDDRSKNSPLTDVARFYASHPIRSWDGYRIGALCVYSSEPRKMRPAELEALRDLAGLVEQELWSTALKPQGLDT